MKRKHLKDVTFEDGDIWDDLGKCTVRVPDIPHRGLILLHLFFLTPSQKILLVYALNKQNSSHTNVRNDIWVCIPASKLI